jgi:hypothetical protein
VSDARDASGIEGDLAGSPELYPHQIDLRGDRVLLLRLTRQDYSEASFLDQRLLDDRRARAWYSWDRIRSGLEAGPAGAAPHYLFHVGHCGSTLISRLLDELGALPLREPLPLRTLAELHARIDARDCPWPRPVFDERLSLMLRMLARGRMPKAVKPSSFCNDLAPAILAQDAATRATIVYATPRAYVANLLAGPNSRRDLEALTAMRSLRLAARIGAPAADSGGLTPGIAAALNWAAEMTALSDLAGSAAGARVLALDFDRFLGDVHGQLRVLAAHAMPDVPAERVAAVSASATLTRYSKAPEYPYDTALRQRVRADAEHHWGAEIRAGLAWLEGAARRHRAIERAVSRFQGA